MFVNALPSKLTDFGGGRLHRFQGHPRTSGCVFVGLRDRGADRRLLLLVFGRNTTLGASLLLFLATTLIFPPFRWIEVL